MGDQPSTLTWTAETPPRWDDDKIAIIGGAPDGIFKNPGHAAGDIVGGEWWRVESDGEVLGYGWMDINWGDAEILMAVSPAHQHRGIGTFIVERLAAEANRRGLNYLLNVVRPTHPDGEGLTRWLAKRGFTSAPDGGMRRATLPTASSD